MKKAIWTIVFLFWLAGQVLAGWIVNSKEDGKTTQIYFNGTKVMMEDSEGSSIIDLVSGELIIINHQQKTIYSGKMSELKEIVSGGLKKSMAMMQEQMQALPPEQRAAMEKMMGKMMPKKAKKVVPTIKKVGMETVAGHQCTKYQIWVEGVLKEELWLAKDLPFLKDLPKGGDLGKIFEMNGELEQMSGSSNFHTHKEYLSLMKNQFPMKSRDKLSDHPMSMGNKSWHTYEVVSYKEANVDAKFVLPKNYVKKSLKSMFSSAMDQ